MGLYDMPLGIAQAVSDLNHKLINNQSQPLSSAPDMFMMSLFSNSLYENIAFNPFANQLLMGNNNLFDYITPSNPFNMVNLHSNHIDNNVQKTAFNDPVADNPKPRSFIFRSDNTKPLTAVFEVYDEKKGKKLADAAKKESSILSRQRKKEEAKLTRINKRRRAQGKAPLAEPTGSCSKGVRLSLEKAGVSKGFNAPSAYQGTDQLRENENFKEIEVSKDDLKKLPAGCVVVWNPYYDKQGDYHKHGHIAITTGNGKELSDRPRDLIIADTYAVFVPVDSTKKDDDKDIEVAENGNNSDLD